MPAGSMVRAYADDIGIVLQNITTLDIVASTFSLLARAAALQVNIDKTVFVPLYPTTELQANKDIRDTQWYGMSVSIGYGKYLGFYVGPSATATVNIEGPMNKFRTRAAHWLALRHIGSFFQCMGFNMCALSVLLFVSQLYRVPESFLKEISDTCLKFMLSV